MSAEAIVMNPKDNVATLLSDAKAGAIVVARSVGGDVVKEMKATQPVPFGHKIAIGKIAKNEMVLKYGEVIGEATKPIKKGEHVHVHNVGSLRVAERQRSSAGGIT